MGNPQNPKTPKSFHITLKNNNMEIKTVRELAYNAKMAHWSVREGPIELPTTPLAKILGHQRAFSFQKIRNMPLKIERFKV